MPGPSQIPATDSPVKQRNDPFNTVNASASASASIDRPDMDNQNGQADPGPSTWDYTENAPQGVVDAIAIERAREEKEGPPDMISGSLGSWGVEEGKLSRLVAMPTADASRRSILPSSIDTRACPTRLASQLYCI